ncbi:MAG TPA: thioredoxin family protein [Methanospirillum sp.]|nr:thioredoxin family protein [Methanospirillum sp.]
MPKTFEITILGCDCPVCDLLDRHVREAASNMKIDAMISHTCEEEQVKKYDIRKLPALIINGRLEIEGQLPSIFEIEDMITQR